VISTRCAGGDDIALAWLLLLLLLLR